MHCTEFRFSLEIDKTVSQVSLNMKKGDAGRKLLIHLTKDGVPWHISTRYTAVFKAETPAGKQIKDKCSISRCLVQYDNLDTITSAVGIYTCEIVISDADGARITSASFRIIVEYATGDDESCVDPDALPIAESISVDGAAVSMSYYFNSDGESDTKINMKAAVGEENGRAIVDPYTLLHLKTSASEFGNAEAADVVAGKTFTSSAGLKRTGTHKCTGGGQISATDDGEGNVIVSMTGFSAASDDDGNIVIT